MQDGKYPASVLYVYLRNPVPAKFGSATASLVQVETMAVVLASVRVGVMVEDEVW